MAKMIQRSGENNPTGVVKLALAERAGVTPSPIYGVFMPAARVIGNG